MNKPRGRVCIVAAVPMTFAAFMAPHVHALSQFWQLTLVANAQPGELSSLCGPRVAFVRIPIARRVSIFSDVCALISLWRLFRQQRFDIVHSITPKAGLLTMVASRLAGVPVRLHWFTGQVWKTKRGLSRWLFKSMDRVLAGSATHLLADSESQRRFLVQEGVVSDDAVTVLANGSVNGVDLARFRPDRDARRRVRQDLGIADNAIVALLIGRLTREKGVLELGAAFGRASQRCPRLHLVVVGPDEEQLRPLIAASLGAAQPRTHFVDYSAQPEAFMAAADFFVLPSHREGFGSTVIEAAGCGLPAIATRIYGLTDAVADGESGVLIPPHDIDALVEAIVHMASDDAGRVAMGHRARARAERMFAQPLLTEALISFYERVASARCTG